MKALLLMMLALFSAAAVVARYEIPVALPAVSAPALFQQPPEDPHDPAGWICDRKADPKNDVRACACQLLCSTDEDGTQHTQESSVCRRYCTRDKCACNMETQCKAERLR